MRLMYKITVYRLVDGGIVHQEQQVSENVYIFLFVNVLLSTCNVTFF